MPTIYGLKPAFQRILRPAVGFLARRGATPNQVTVAALAGSVAWGAWLCLAPGSRLALGLLPAWLLLRMALNAVDGLLAREHGMASRAGLLLNELGDVASDMALYAPLALVPGLAPALVVAAVLLSALAELAGVLGVQVGGRRRYDGPMGKSDRAFAFGLLGLLLGLGVPPGAWCDALLAAVLALLLMTLGNRTRKALREGRP